MNLINSTVGGKGMALFVFLQKKETDAEVEKFAKDYKKGKITLEELKTIYAEKYAVLFENILCSRELYRKTAASLDKREGAPYTYGVVTEPEYQKIMADGYKAMSKSDLQKLNYLRREIMDKFAEVVDLYYQSMKLALKTKEDILLADLQEKICVVNETIHKQVEEENEITFGKCAEKDITQFEELIKLLSENEYKFPIDADGFLVDNEKNRYEYDYIIGDGMVSDTIDEKYREILTEDLEA